MIILLISIWRDIAITRKLFLQEPPEDDGLGAFGELFAAYLNDFFIEILKAAATTFWFFEKIAAGINRFLTEEDMWDRVLDSTMSTLEGTMPAILQGVIFSGDAGGIIYIALFMAGLLMIIPSVNHLRFVDPTRAITWAIVIVVLFISASGSSGYDLIGLVEQMRAGAVQLVVESTDDGEGLDKLVAQPMMANESDLEDYGWILAEDFEEEYFPEATDYEERNVILFDTPFYTWQTSFEVESQEGQQERREKAETGLAIAALTIVAAFVLFMFGVIFATLTASALILIVFFLVSLPLGFFEFGAGILNGILKQYAYLWAITLLAVILPSILVAAGTLAYPDDGPASPAQIMAFIPILIIVTIATSYVSAMAANAMTDTFSVISTSISTAMAPINYAGRMPSGGVLGGGPLQAGANVAATAALAAATGGVGAALMAGGGSMIGQISEGGGQAIGALATGVMGKKANVFASAARGRGAAQVAGVAGGNRRRQREKEEKQRQAEQSQRERQEQLDQNKAQGQAKSNQAQFVKAHGSPDDLPQASWDSIDAGNYLTANRNNLNDAEQAYTKGQFTTARSHLTQAFGSREIAHQVMQHYDEHGQAGMQQVRQIVETTQDTAQQIAIDGGRLFDRKGNASPEFKKRLWHGLQQLDSYDSTDPALAASISGAVVRPPGHLPNHDLLASFKLAQTVIDPNSPQAEVSDQPALLALHDMIRPLGLGAQQLEALFEATRSGRALALSGKQTGVDSVVQKMAMHSELADLNQATSKELARLALLVTKPPYDRKPSTQPLPTAPIRTELFDTQLFETESLSSGTAGTSPNQAKTNPVNKANPRLASSTAVINAAIAYSPIAIGVRNAIVGESATVGSPPPPPPPPSWDHEPPPQQTWDVGLPLDYRDPFPPPRQSASNSGTSQWDVGLPLDNPDLFPSPRQSASNSEASPPSQSDVGVNQVLEPTTPQAGKPDDDAFPQQASHEEFQDQPSQLPIKIWDQVSVEEGEGVPKPPTFHQVPEQDDKLIDG